MKNKSINNFVEKNKTKQNKTGKNGMKKIDSEKREDDDDDDEKEWMLKEREMIWNDVHTHINRRATYYQNQIKQRTSNCFVPISHFSY